MKVSCPANLVLECQSRSSKELQTPVPLLDPSQNHWAQVSSCANLFEKLARRTSKTSIIYHANISWSIPQLASWFATMALWELPKLWDANTNCQRIAGKTPLPEPHRLVKYRLISKIKRNKYNPAISCLCSVNIAQTCMYRSICAHVRMHMHMHMHIVYVQGVYTLKLYAYIHFTLGTTNANPNNNSNTGLQSAPWGCCFRRGGTQTMFPQQSCNINCHSWIKLSPLFHCQTMMLYDFCWGATLEPFLFGMRWPNGNMFHACASSATQRKSPTQCQVKIVICFQVATLWSLKTWRAHLSHPQAIPTSQPNGCLSAKALWAGVRPWRWLRWNLEGLQLGVVDLVKWGNMGWIRRSTDEHTWEFLVMLMIFGHMMNPLVITPPWSSC